MSTIAFIGLGIMGSPMATHLVKAGHTVVGVDTSQERTAALVEAGGTAAEAVEEARHGSPPGSGRSHHRHPAIIRRPPDRPLTPR